MSGWKLKPICQPSRLEQSLFEHTLADVLAALAILSGLQSNFQAHGEPWCFQERRPQSVHSAGIRIGDARKVCIGQSHTGIYDQLG